MSNGADLIIMILIVGVLTGIGEEFVFRGVLQRLFLDKFRNPHIAVWITAVIFSAVHFQFYGFVPRMLLGAFFGYLLVWSGNIWLPIIAHALNNSFSVAGAYIQQRAGEESFIDTLGTTGEDIAWVVGGVILTIFTIGVLRYRLLRQKNIESRQLTL